MRLCASVGFYRDGLGGPDPEPLSLGVTSLTLVLSAAPTMYLHDPGNPAPAEAERLWAPSYVGSAYTSHDIQTIDAGGTTHVLGPVYSRVQSDAWTGFAPRGTNNVNRDSGGDWAIIQVVANFSDGVVGEQIRLAECSFWFAYE